MSQLQDYVKKEFFELHEDDWSTKMVLAFNAKAMELDTDVHNQIKDIDMDEFKDAVSIGGVIFGNLIDIENAMIVNAKNQINLIIEDIQYVFDQEETESQLRSDFERTEGAAINRDRR